MRGDIEIDTVEQQNREAPMKGTPDRSEGAEYYFTYSKYSAYADGQMAWSSL